MKTKLNKTIDFAFLKTKVVDFELFKACKKVIENNYYGLCVYPEQVNACKEKFKNTECKVISVISFPHGCDSITDKCSAIKMTDADEFDVVLNLQKIKDNEFCELDLEIRTLRQVTKDKILKIIIEQPFWPPATIARLLHYMIFHKVDFVKTCTGTNGGTKLEYVKLLKTFCNDAIKIKASGGIKTEEQAIELINAGAERIGTSSLLFTN